jgi:hypothetical protein
MQPSDVAQTGYAQLQLLFSLVVICAFLAVVLPLLLERIARRGY